MNPSGLDAGRGQPFGQPIGAVLGPCEHERLPDLAACQFVIGRVTDGHPLVATLHLVVAHIPRAEQHHRDIRLGLGQNLGPKRLCRIGNQPGQQAAQHRIDQRNAQRLAQHFTFAADQFDATKSAQGTTLASLNTELGRSNVVMDVGEAPSTREELAAVVTGAGGTPGRHLGCSPVWTAWARCRCDRGAAETTGRGCRATSNRGSGRTSGRRVPRPNVRRRLRERRTT